MQLKGMRLSWDIRDKDLPKNSNLLSNFDLWPDGHVQMIYDSRRCPEAPKHVTGWAMRNTNNHNIHVLKKSCLGVLVCSGMCWKGSTSPYSTPSYSSSTSSSVHDFSQDSLVAFAPIFQSSSPSSSSVDSAVAAAAAPPPLPLPPLPPFDSSTHYECYRPAICDKARTKQLEKPCPHCGRKLELKPCGGQCGFPVTHFWRSEGHLIYFQGKGKHDHPKPTKFWSAAERKKKRKQMKETTEESMKMKRQRPNPPKEPPKVPSSPGTSTTSASPATTTTISNPSILQPPVQHGVPNDVQSSVTCNQINITWPQTNDDHFHSFQYEPEQQQQQHRHHHHHHHHHLCEDVASLYQSFETRDSHLGHHGHHGQDFYPVNSTGTPLNSITSTNDTPHTPHTSHSFTDEDYRDALEVLMKNLSGSETTDFPACSDRSISSSRGRLHDSRTCQTGVPHSTTSASSYAFPSASSYAFSSASSCLDFTLDFDTDWTFTNLVQQQQQPPHYNHEEQVDYFSTHDPPRPYGHPTLVNHWYDDPPMNVPMERHMNPPMSLFHRRPFGHACPDHV